MSDKYKMIRDLIVGNIKTPKPKSIAMNGFNFLRDAGVQLYVKIMTAEEKRKFNDIVQMVNKTLDSRYTVYDHPTIIAWTIVYGLCDEDGTNIFNESDVPWLRSDDTDRRFKSELWWEILTFNHIMYIKEDEVLKNSEGTGTSSPSSKPADSGDVASDESSKPSEENLPSNGPTTQDGPSNSSGKPTAK